MKKPDCYRTPLRSRAAIEEFLLQITTQRWYDRATHPFCFKVKLYRLDLSFEHLLEMYQESIGHALFLRNPEWLQQAKEVYEQQQENLFDWGVEGARGVLDNTDCFNHLWDGTPVKVAFSFEGRSGGWLSVNSFEGVEFLRADPAQLLSEQPFSWLRKFYQFMVMLEYDVRHPENEVEHHAAWALFANCCADLPQPDTIQLTFPFVKEAS